MKQENYRYTNSLLAYDIQDTEEIISSHMSTLFYTVTAGPTVSTKLLYLCLKHYDLASTTVTGIPMKVSLC